MLKIKGTLKFLSVVALFAGLTACGGGGGSDSSSQVSNTPTTAGSGSTITSADSGTTQGTINYLNYRSFLASMNDKTWALPTVAANVTYNATSKAGSIQFPILGGTELVSTTDGYATTTWTGPMTKGLYNYNGNVLVGCNTNAAIATEATQVLVSTSMERVKEMAKFDALNGYTFDVTDCSQTTQVQTLKFNTDGTVTMALATANTVLTENQKNNFLIPESFGGVLVNGKYFGGHVYRYNKDGVNKYAIVLQTTTGNFTSQYRYMIAVQR